MSRPTSPDRHAGTKSTISSLSMHSAMERIYSRIIERMLEGAVVLSNEGMVLYCNPSFTRMIRLESSALVGHSLRDRLTSSGGISLEQLLDSDDAVQADFELMSAHGEAIPVSVSASSIDDQETDTMLRCLVVSDLRTRHDVAQLREAKAALETANQRKNEFLAMLGHELRNPLAPVRQAAELLAGCAAPDDPGYLVRAREVLSRQVVHLTRLVDDLLDAGRVTQGTLIVEPDMIDLRDVVYAALEGVSSLVEHHKHDMRTRIPHEAVLCRGDVVRLTQVVTNLLSNAAKYTPNGGRIDLELRCDDEWAHVEISDNGRGIAEELLPHLFDPFVRGQTTIDRKMGGLGVGLTLVERLVELHEGRVEAKSDGVDKGSTFVVSLPLGVRSGATVAPEPPSPIDEAPDSSSCKVLVVDDNEDAADMLTLVLRTRGYHVESACDGEDALSRLTEFVPDVVCLDIGLPGLDGYEVGRRIRRARGAATLIIALTGYGSEMDRQRALDAGMDFHLVKPVDIEALEGTIQAWLSDPKRNSQRF